jgi:arsenate reductase
MQDDSIQMCRATAVQERAMVKGGKKVKVLFLSTGDSARSQMAEGILRSLAQDKLVVVSAGIEGGGSDPLAAEVMREVGIDIHQQRARNVSQALKDHFGYVITLYDSAKERSPIFPFTPHLLQWDVKDPEAAQGSQVDRKEAFRRVRDQIRTQIQNFLGDTASAQQQDHGVLAYG